MKHDERYTCDYCGEDCGPADTYDPGPHSCGAAECERFVCDTLEAEREEAHRQLDEELGYGY